MMSRAHRSRLAGASAAVLAAVALAATASVPAWAHSQLVASTPSEGATLTELPREFSVTLNERVLTDAGTSAFALRVTDASGQYYGTGCLDILEATVSTPATIGPAGSYTLEWQVVSADGHTVGGEIPFEWAPAGEFEPAAGSAEAPRCGDDPSVTADESADTHHDADPAPIAIGDVLWIVGAVLIIAVGVTVALLATRRRSTD
jgi:hypothetical protein